MKIHLIAIGGSIMHNLAICLQKAGHKVSGSDDEIYEPAKSRLGSHGLLPTTMGWHPEIINSTLDLVILGMHAKSNNPELLMAQQLDLKVMSFPEFIGEHGKSQKRVVVAGSHGKTTTTSMIMHVLRYWAFDFDYLVGAQLNGFDTMVKLTDAPLIVIEGDEYLSSAIDRVPKIWHYRPHITIITGVAWDHMNVFPTLESYHDAFRGYFNRLPDGAKVYYAADDEFLETTLVDFKQLDCQAYTTFNYSIDAGISQVFLDGNKARLQIFGQHNMANLKAAYLVLKELGITDKQFLKAISSFQGAAKRLQLRREKPTHLIYQDFAHAPSKVKATVQAMKNQYPDRLLTAVIELHTYSSLNQDFLPQYQDAMEAADQAVVFYSEHTLSMKGMPPLAPELIRKSFNRHDLLVITKKEELIEYLENQSTWEEHNLLLMSSGTFDGLNIDSVKTL